jgi:hypothetical protein
MNRKSVLLIVALLSLAICVNVSGHSNQLNVLPQAQQGDNTQIRIFTGTVWMNGGKFVLRDESQKAWYLLDDQRSAARFEGKKVKVQGMLNAANDAIHVLGIEEDPIHRGSLVIPANPLVAMWFVSAGKEDKAGSQFLSKPIAEGLDGRTRLALVSFLPVQLDFHIQGFTSFLHFRSRLLTAQRIRESIQFVVQ